jgi:CheY-like chemotaxis protein
MPRRKVTVLAIAGRSPAGQYGCGPTASGQSEKMACSAAILKSLWMWLGIMVHLPSDGPEDALRAHDVRAKAPSREPRIDDATRALRILVVDDLVDAADGLAIYLTKHGHLVRTAHDGHAALTAAADFAPQVILLDIGLPRLDGYCVAEQIRQQSSLQSVCLIAVTGFCRAEDIQAAYDAGLDHFLLKPVDPTKLLAVLKSLVVTP